MIQNHIEAIIRSYVWKVYNHMGYIQGLFDRYFWIEPSIFRY